MKDIKKIKEQLYDHCVEFAEKRLNNVREAIRSSLESANEENKSSAGDKHETGRSMAQLEQENLSFQLLESEKLLAILSSVERGKISSLISVGSLVLTDNGNYFIFISAGKLMIDKETYYAVSAVSPIGTALLKSAQHQAFSFNGKNYGIKKVY